MIKFDRRAWLGTLIIFLILMVGSAHLFSQVFVPFGFRQGHTGALTISDTPSFDYGNNFQNIPVDKTFILSNSSGTPVMGITPNAFSDPTFSFKGGSYPGTGGTCSRSLQIGNSCTIIVTALSSAAGTFNSSVSLDYKSQTGTVNLSLPISATFNLWSPASLGTDLAAWYDASDLASVRTGAGGASPAANGNPVSQWQDKSGNGRHANQATAARQPILNTTAWTGGLPTIVWDNDDDGMTVTGLTWQTYTIALLMRHITVKNVGAFLTKRAAVSTNFFWFSFTSNIVNWDQNGNRYATGFTPSAGTDYSYILIRPNPGTNRAQYVNGTLSGSTGTNNNDNNTHDLIIGNDYSATGRSINAYISELVIVTAAVTAADRERIEGYLAWKWGNVAALPGAHPYKAAPP